VLGNEDIVNYIFDGEQKINAEQGQKLGDFFM
jgi:HTH-type transcriptional regulator / antitoxin HigA